MCTNTSNRISLLAAGVLAILLLSACRHNQETPAAFAILPQSDVVAPGSTFTVTASHLPQDCTITWLVDGGTVEGKGVAISATASPHEKRHTVQAQCNRDGQVIASATCHVYSTSHPALIKTVHSFLDQHNIQTAVSVAVQGNDVDFSIDTGYTSLSTRESNGSGTLHYIYSITKTFVAAAVLQLVEEGKLTLNTTVGDILPEVEFDPVYINTSATVAELLSHTSGIQEYVDNPALFYKNPYRTSQWNPQFLLPFVQSPKTERGLFTYSSMNYILLGLMVERVSDTTAAQLIQNQFLQPLGLEATFLAPQDTVDSGRIAHPHVYPGTTLSLVGDGKTPIDITTVITDALELLGKSSWTAGGMVSRAEDIARWGYELYSRNAVVSPAIRDKMLDSVSRFSQSDKEAYGYGIRKIYHNSASLIGSYGRSIGSENCMFYNPNKDTCYVILTSSNTSKDRTPNIDQLLFSLQETTP